MLKLVSITCSYIVILHVLLSKMNKGSTDCKNPQFLYWRELLIRQSRGERKFKLWSSFNKYCCFYSLWSRHLWQFSQLGSVLAARKPVGRKETWDKILHVSSWHNIIVHQWPLVFVPSYHTSHLPSTNKRTIDLIFKDGDLIFKDGDGVMQYDVL